MGWPQTLEHRPSSLAAARPGPGRGQASFDLPHPGRGGHGGIALRLARDQAHWQASFVCNSFGKPGFTRLARLLSPCLASIALVPGAGATDAARLALARAVRSAARLLSGSPRSVGDKICVSLTQGRGGFTHLARVAVTRPHPASAFHPTALGGIPKPSDQG